jgi:hypothetical protein
MPNEKFQAVDSEITLFGTKDKPTLELQNDKIRSWLHE